MKTFLLLILLSVAMIPAFAQVYQGLVVPDDKGRWGTASEITQASGLALDNNGFSFWTHNDQGNATTKVYKILPAAGQSPVTLQKEVTILNTLNLDWEDMAKDTSGNIYLCQIGKNCNTLSDPLECPGRFVYKIHRLPLATLNNADSNDVTPETFYFKYPINGYDVNNCSANDTVFVNGEAAIWFEGAIYIFTKAIWSKSTNNCGGWQDGYSYLFKVPLVGNSSLSAPLVAEYISKVNLKMNPGDASSKYNVTGAAISPDKSVLALITYGRLWQFRNFTSDNFFNGSSVYADFSNTGTDTITRGYEGIEMMNNDYALLCVDGVNGRLSGINTDSIALWVSNKNDAGAGSLRNALLAASNGDTIHFKSVLANDTIHLLSPLVLSRGVHLLQPDGQPVYIDATATSNAITVNNGVNATLKNIRIICGDGSTSGIINNGVLHLENIIFYNSNKNNFSLLNNGNIVVAGYCELK